MYNIFKKENYHTIGIIKEEENEKITDKLEIQPTKRNQRFRRWLNFIELPKFLKSKEIGNKKLRQWLDFICNKRKEKIEMAVSENEKIAKANREWEYLKGDEAVKRMAFLREKWERDWNSSMHNAEDKGIVKGRKAVAIKMLEKNIEEKIIAEVTNFSLEEIEKIKDEIKYKVKK